MDDELVYVPGGDDSFLELSRTAMGKPFRKHILSKGPLYHSSLRGGKLDVDDKFFDTVIKNFNDHVVSHVQAPVVDGNNRHTEDPDRNIGEIIGLEREGDKLYAIIDVRDEKAIPKMGKTYLGASAMFATNWKNNKTNQYVGPTLVHTAITNNAHVNDLDDFEEVLLSVDDSTSKAVFLSAAPTSKESIMDLDEMIAVLREEHGIDIPELQKAAGKAESFAKLSAELQEKLSNGENAVLKLSNADDEASAEDIVAAVADLVQSRVELSAKVDTLVQESALAKAEARIEELVAGAFISPAKRESNLKLLLSNPELFEEMLPEKPLVALSAESGNEIKDETHDETVVGEIARLAADAEANGLTVKA